MKTKNRKMLPKTAAEIHNGGLYLQRVRCGKSNCKCAKGEYHTAYYFFTRVAGKLTKTYIRRSEVAQFAEIVNKASTARFESMQAKKNLRDLIKDINARGRETAAFIKMLNKY